MPLDAITLSALASELSRELAGGRIDKVQQPEKDMLLISLRNEGRNKKLLACSGTGAARIHLTENTLENPSEAPMFCMLMRKHLVGARILSVYQPDMERMLVTELMCRDEMGVDSKKLLITEMIGRSSNVILVGSDGRIIDCMRRADFSAENGRNMLPGMIYRFPPKQNKIDFFKIPFDELKKMVLSADRDLPADKWLLSSFSGLSPLICRELSFRAGGSYDELLEYLKALRDTVSGEIYTPTMVLRNGEPADFSFMPIRQYGSGSECTAYPDFSKLLDAFYLRRDLKEQQRRRSHQLRRSVKTSRDRLVKKLANQTSELQQTENMDDIRKKAELVTANIYRMKKGDRKLTCQDYYSEDMRDIIIELDPLKSPQQNSAALFKQYNKLKGAKEHLTVLIARGEAQLDYLNSVLEELDRAESEKDIGVIKAELLDTGYIKKKKNSKPGKLKKQPPHRFISDDGYEILAGRSNSQNDELTTKLARRTDIWLHTQGVHGSHVIISCEGTEPPERTIEQAASLAVYYSQGREAGKIPVDYTMVRFVRKPSGSMPGKVIYTDYKTIVAQADEKLADRLKK